MIISKKELFDLIDLDEIPDQIDISINMPPKKVPEETKRALKRDSKTIQLF